MRKFFLFAAVLFVAIQTWAAPVDVKTAKSHAQSFISQKLYDGKLAAPISGELKMVYAEMNSKMLDRVVYYVFNTQNGFVIVSGDDRAEQILGYGDYPLDMNNIPNNMRAWLGTYKDQLEYLQAHEGMQVETPSMMAVRPMTRTVTFTVSCMSDEGLSEKL